jgi:hypothetical protein
MALVAKETLRAGHRLYANPGTVVSQAVVDRYGWHELVYEDSEGAKPETGKDKPARQSAKRTRKKS